MLLANFDYIKQNVLQSEQDNLTTWATQSLFIEINHESLVLMMSLMKLVDNS